MISKAGPPANVPEPVTESPAWARAVADSAADAAIVHKQPVTSLIDSSFS